MTRQESINRIIWNATSRGELPESWASIESMLEEAYDDGFAAGCAW